MGKEPRELDEVKVQIGQDLVGWQNKIEWLKVYVVSETGNDSTGSNQE